MFKQIADHAISYICRECGNQIDGADYYCPDCRNDKDAKEPSGIGMTDIDSWCRLRNCNYKCNECEAYINYKKWNK